MIRFPNPGSDIDNFVAVYNAAFDQLYGQLFDLDDFVAAVVKENLATSSGYMGKAAIARSTRPDRSRDPLYNQLKMYSEIFRALGLDPPDRAKCAELHVHSTGPPSRGRRSILSPLVGGNGSRNHLPKPNAGGKRKPCPTAVCFFCC